MLGRIRLLFAMALVVLLLTTVAYSAPLMVGKIILSESPFEKFGTLFLPFTFNTEQLYILCEFGVNAAQPGCVNGVVSDFISVTNAQVAGAPPEGRVSMLSDTQATGGVVPPPDFPLPGPGAPPPIFLPETGRPQILSPKAGLPTTNPDGTPGPNIKVTATSDLDPVPPTPTSDMLIVSTL
jgi:hypothetical protein